MHLAHYFLIIYVISKLFHLLLVLIQESEFIEWMPVFNMCPWSVMCSYQEMKRIDWMYTCMCISLKRFMGKSQSNTISSSEGSSSIVSIHVSMDLLVIAWKYLHAAICKKFNRNSVHICDVFFRNQTELGRAQNWEIAKEN